MKYQKVRPADDNKNYDIFLKKITEKRKWDLSKLWKIDPTDYYGNNKAGSLQAFMHVEL